MRLENVSLLISKRQHAVTPTKFLIRSVRCWSDHVYHCFFSLWQSKHQKFKINIFDWFSFLFLNVWLPALKELNEWIWIWWINILLYLLLKYTFNGFIRHWTLTIENKCHAISGFTNSIHVHYICIDAICIGDGFQCVRQKAWSWTIVSHSEERVWRVHLCHARSTTRTFFCWWKKSKLHF